MANGQCDWGDAPHARNHILTTIDPPGTVELCDDHYGPGLIPILAAELGVEPGPFYENVKRYIDRELAKAAKATVKAQAAEAAAAEDDDGLPGHADYDPGPEVDDEGGMSEVRGMLAEDVQR